MLYLSWFAYFCFIFQVYGRVYTPDGYTEGSVFVKDGQASFVAGSMDKAAAAYGYYNNTLLTTGWGTLEISAGRNPKTADNDLMFAAGYLEGVFTAGQMQLHYQNVRPFYITGNHPKELEQKFRQYFKEQDAWTREMLDKYGNSDSYWRHVGYVESQMDGLIAGLMNVTGNSLEESMFVVQFLNSVGDLIDLRHALSKQDQPNFHKMTPAELLDYFYTRGHCSALVKVLGAYENLYMSHSSWFIYSATMRIYKHYHFNLKDPDTAAKDMSFSSYPGFLESLDDFYLLSSQMVLLQTTNSVFNMSLYDSVGPNSLLAWQRVRLANMMANSGEEWYKYFKKYNSGTYNNQYMIIDLKKVELHKDIHDGALWVVEQIPELVVGGDQTPILRTGYWPSYNVPFYEVIFNRSGYPDAVKKSGVDMSYQLAPRAKIFRRDQATVTDMKTMKHIMRYNDFKHDPYSEGNACNTICCRGDLNEADAKPDGCYDTKVSDMNMALNFKASIINGPTLGNDLPPFSWTGPFASTAHAGLPDVYNFDWQAAEPLF